MKVMEILMAIVLMAVVLIIVFAVVVIRALISLISTHSIDYGCSNGNSGRINGDRDG